MTTSGWILMICSLVFVWSGTLWCFWQVLKSPTETSKASEQDT